MSRILVFVFFMFPSFLFADEDVNGIPTREPDAVSVPANLSDYYIYDSETNEWVWAEDYKTEKHQKKISAKPSEGLKKQLPKQVKKVPTIEKIKNKIKDRAMQKAIKEGDEWVIIARGVTRTQIEVNFPFLDKKKYELCRFDHDTSSLDCSE